MHGGNAGLGSGIFDGMERAGEQDDQEEETEGDGEKSSIEKESHSHKERRLDDFWSMTLKR
jgi:hypothetical protein